MHLKIHFETEPCLASPPCSPHRQRQRAIVSNIIGDIIAVCNRKTHWQIDNASHNKIIPFECFSFTFLCMNGVVCKCTSIVCTATHTHTSKWWYELNRQWHQVSCDSTLSKANDKYNFEVQQRWAEENLKINFAIVHTAHGTHTRTCTVLESRTKMRNDSNG